MEDEELSCASDFDQFESFEEQSVYGLNQEVPADVDEEQDVVECGQSNPLEIPEIREEIFSYLGTRDILRCRIVNHRWSNEGLLLLQRANNTIRLGKHNIRQHVKFLHSIQSSPFILNYDISFAKCANDRDIQDMFEDISALTQLYGPNCIDKLDFTVPEGILESRWEQFYGLLENVGAGLTSLQIYETMRRANSLILQYLQLTCDWARLFKTLETSAQGLQHLHVYESPFAEFSGEIPMPKLSNLVSFSGRMNPNPALIAQLVQHSPKLRNLTLSGSTEMDVQYRQIRNLLTFMKQCFDDKISLGKIEYLEIGVGHALTYMAIQKFEYTNLRSLKLYIMKTIEGEDAEHLRDFLKDNCPALESLEFVFSCSFGCNEFALSIPALPNLKHFGFGIGADNTNTEGLCISRFEGISDNLTSLESFSLSLGVCFFAYALLEPNPKTWSKSCRPRTPLQFKKVLINEEDLNPSMTHMRDWNSDFIKLDRYGFPSVTTLDFTLMFIEFATSSIADWQPSLRQNIEQVRALFPSLRKLVIDNQIGAEDSLYTKEVVQAIFETLDGVEELEFKNYRQDWISKVICDSELAVENLSNVRRLKFPEIEGTGFFCTPSIPRPFTTTCDEPTQRPIISLATFLKYLPNLELLQVASPSTSTPWTESIAEVKKLRKMRPNVVIEYL